MATIATTSRSADTEYLVRNAMTKGYQISSLFAAPLYLAYAFSTRGRGFSINRLLRATWVGGFGDALGMAASGGLAYGWYNTCNEELLRSKRLKAAYNTGRIRADDHATIGAVLTSVLMTGVFWKRAGVVNLVLGGAGIGSSIGFLTHYGRSLLGDTPEEVQVPITVSH